MSKLTASYLAGFIDGEGYFGIYPVSREGRKTYYISCVKVANTNKEIIEWMHNSFGGFFHTRHFANNCKTAYTWTLTDARVVPFIEKIIPYLKIKRPQAELVLKREKLKLKLKNMGERKGMVYPDNILKEIENCCTEIRKLNARGKSLHAERLSKETPNGDAIVRTLQEKQL